MDPLTPLIVDTYHRTHKVVATAAELGITHHRVTAALNKAGVPRYGTRRYLFDQTFFDTIDTEAKAYFLGFLWADGNNDGIGAVSLKLSANDRGVLEQLRQAIGSQRPLYDVHNVRCTDKHGIVHVCNNAVMLGLSSVEFSRKLADIGLTPRKTATLRMPTVVPSHLMRHFVRGLFDGDGSVTRRVGLGRTVPSYGVEMCAKNAAFVADLNEVLWTAIGIRMRVRPNGTIHKMYLCRRSDQITFLAWLYNGATLYLPRKEHRYREIVSRATQWSARRTSQYRGISCKRGVYIVRKAVNGQLTHLGRFATEQDAIQCLKDHEYAISKTT